MSVYVSTLVWQESKATATDLLVLVAIADQANDDGQCWPGNKKLAERCRISERTLQRCINNLITLGELEILEDGNGRTHKRKLDVILYSRKDDNLSPFKSERVTSQAEKGDKPGSPAPLFPPSHTLPSLSPHLPVEPSIEPKEKNIKKESSVNGTDLFGSSKSRAGSLEEVINFIVNDPTCQQQELETTDARWFWDHEESRDWMNGKGKIKDWQATIRAWAAQPNIFPSRKIQNSALQAQQRAEANIEARRPRTITGF